MLKRSIEKRSFGWTMLMDFDDSQQSMCMSVSVCVFVFVVYFIFTHIFLHLNSSRTPLTLLLRFSSIPFFHPFPSASFNLKDSPLHVTLFMDVSSILHLYEWRFYVLLLLFVYVVTFLLPQKKLQHWCSSSQSIRRKTTIFLGITCCWCRSRCPITFMRCDYKSKSIS